MSLKEKLMNNMMDKQFSKMTAEERQAMMDAMMDKFFSGMTDEEKQGMMQNMMSKMMGGEGGNPMMGMTSMMMNCDEKEGKRKMPWDMCGEMMASFKETANTAKFATPELRGLFDEWCQQIEQEILTYIKETGKINIGALVEKFSLSQESIKFLLGRLAAKNLIDYKI